MILAIFILLVLIIRSILLLIQYSLHHYETYKLIKKIPGPDIRFPFWGNVSMTLNILRNSQPGLQSKEFINLLSRLSEEYDPEGKHGMIRLWFGPFVPIVVITDAHVAQKVLNSKYHLDKATFYSLFRFAIYDGIFSCKTERWFHDKRELQTHLKFNALKNYVPNTERHLLKFNERIERCLENNDGKFADVKPLVSTFVLDVLGENLFSTDFATQQKEEEPEFINLVHNMLEISYMAFLKPWTYFFNQKYIAYLFNLGDITRTAHYILKFRSSTRKIIIDRFKQMQKKDENSKSRYVSMLDSLINARLTKESRIAKIRHIESQINTFVVAGHDTTTSSLTWTLYLLGHHPRKQQKLINEIDQFLEDLSCKNEPLTIFNMKRLRYLDACIMETLRLYPSGPYIARKSRQPLRIHRNGQTVILPGQINYIIFIMHMQMNEKYFRKPEQFIPERFYQEELEEEELNRTESDSENELPWVTHSAFLPFSGGHRMCLGKEYGMLQQRMFFINLFRQYRIKSLDKYGQCEPKFNFLLSSAHFPIQFLRRNL